MVRSTPLMLRRTHGRGPVLRRVMPALALSILTATFLAPELLGLAETFPFLVIVAGRPVAAVGLIVMALVVVVLKRRWWPAGVAIWVVAGVALGYVVISRAIPGPPPAPARTLTLLSFNVYDGHADLQALAREIKTGRPDVVVLPEAGERYRQLLMPKIAELGYRSWTTGPPGGRDVYGIVVLAGPWLGSVAAEPLQPGTKFRWMQVTGGALGNVRVVAVHTAAPFSELTRNWTTDIATLRRWCGTGHGPTILIGDFNSTLDHSSLRSAVKGCTDAAADRGQGLAATWPSYWPKWFGVQIDHVFTTGTLRPANLQVLDIPGSDHRALLTRVATPFGTGFTPATNPQRPYLTPPRPK